MDHALVLVCRKLLDFFHSPHLFIIPESSNSCDAFSFILQMRNWKYVHEHITKMFHSPCGDCVKLIVS